MSRDVNSNQCTNPTCYEYGDRGSHHHTRIADGVGGAAHFDQTHGGAMDHCPVDECKQVTAGRTQIKGPDPVEEERANAIQNDLINQATDIAEWWVKTAQKDAERTVPKAVEYGAADLDFMGQFMVALVKDKFVGADDAELMRIGREMAVTFYLVGKIGRMIGAFQQGVLPSDDTLFDTDVYATMLRRIRETGDWIK